MDLGEVANSVTKLRLNVGCGRREESALASKVSTRVLGYMGETRVKSAWKGFSLNTCPCFPANSELQYGELFIHIMSPGHGDIRDKATTEEIPLGKGNVVS